MCQKKVIHKYKRWVYDIAGVKSISISMESFFFYKKNRSPPPFVKPLVLTRDISVRDMVGLIIRISFNSFNFYNIDQL